MSKRNKIVLIVLAEVMFGGSLFMGGYFYSANHPADTAAVPDEPTWGQWQTPLVLTNSAALIQIRQSTNTGEAQFRYVPQVK